MILVDSSFLIAFFHKKDSQHEKAIQDMKNYDEQKEDFLISEHVLGETATVLLYYNGLNATKQFLDFAQEKCTIPEWDSGDLHSALLIFKNQKNELSYIDTSVVYLARFLKLPVACYDSKILKEIRGE